MTTNERDRNRHGTENRVACPQIREVAAIIAGAMAHDFNLVVIGSGPTGEKAAVKAAYFGKRVAVVERSEVLGGECRKAGLPSKVLREAALSYSGARRRLGDVFRVAPGERVAMESLL